MMEKGELSYLDLQKLAIEKLKQLGEKEAKKAVRTSKKKTAPVVSEADN